MCIETKYLTVETKLEQHLNKCKNLPCQQRKPRLIWTVTQCRDKTSWCASRNHKQCAQECVGQHHKARRRAASTQACPCDSGRPVMQLHEAQHRYGQLRGNRTPGTALAACALAMVVEIRTTREKNVAMCLECACHNHRRHPPAPRASHASKARGRRCTSAARRAKLYKTAQASCRRPTMRSSHHARRPSIVDTCKNKSANSGKRDD